MEKTIDLLKFYQSEETPIQLAQTNGLKIQGTIRELKLASWLNKKQFVILETNDAPVKIFLDDIQEGTIYPSTIKMEVKVVEEEKPIRKGIPKSVRMELWRNHFGEKFEGRCYCCKNKIERDNFEAGHVEPVSEGGTNELYNLRPICFDCNRSMGNMNLDDFKKEFH